MPYRPTKWRTQPSAAEPRRGIVLLAVILVVAILSLAAYQFADLTMAEYKGAANAQKSVQAKAVADSGIHYILAIIASPDNITTYCNNNLISNSDAFQNVRAGNGTFSFIAPTVANDPGASGYIRYGLIDEGGKLNPNMLLALDPSGDTLYNALLKLPNMDNSIAGAIADYLDADDNPRQDGGESELYGGMTPS